MNVLNTNLNQFINTGLDERIVKGYHMEQVTVHGKHGDYLAMRKKGTNKVKEPPKSRPKKAEEKKPTRNKAAKEEPKGFKVVGKGFLYMPLGGDGKTFYSFKDVEKKYKKEGRKDQSIYSYLKENYYVSDNKNFTVDAYKRNGSYTKERIEKVHEPIIKSIMDSCPKPPEGKKPVCYLYGGGSASGKSTVVGMVVNPKKEIMGYDFGSVDPDAIKATLPEHEMFLAQDKNTAASREHEESSDITKEVIDRLVDEGRTFAYDGTMSKFQKYSDLIKRLKEKNYEVHIVAVDIPLEDAYKRAANRKRKIPKSVVTNTHKSFAKNFMRIINECDVDSAVLYDNSQPEGEAPTLILDSNSLDDPIRDQALYDRFIKKGKDEDEKH